MHITRARKQHNTRQGYQKETIPIRGIGHSRSAVIIDRERPVVFNIVNKPPAASVNQYGSSRIFGQDGPGPSTTVSHQTSKRLLPAWRWFGCLTEPFRRLCYHQYVADAHSAVLFKLILFAVLMAVVPIGTYFTTLKYFAKGTLALLS